MAHVSDIKLIRTDTTLDLSQKAEKGMRFKALDHYFYTTPSLLFLSLTQCGTASESIEATKTIPALLLSLPNYNSPVG